MKVIRITGYEAEPHLDDVSKPVPASGQVLVRVRAASLNPLDVKLQRGYMEQFFPLTFPYTLGTDLAGVIEQLGADVEGWALGDQVVARTDPTAGGAFAEYALVPKEFLAKAPSTLPFNEAAGIPTAAGTAWQALFESFELTEGQKVLIHAGTGGVGSFAIQLAHRVAAKVIATASGSGLDIVRLLGADMCIDYRREDFTRKLSDIDVVLDTMGGEIQRRSFDVLRAGGHLLSTVMPPDDTLAAAHNVTAGFVFHASDGQRLARVSKAIDQYGLRILVDRTVPFTEFIPAFQHQASGHARGKIIITFD
ncbi:NADP-dependent oxidoreductase [Vreelandella titanicae]|jgi:NADPH:quinone reductase-like Zn-dependent oxidoreductase|uniref:NADP-dependent oxidoreductase n=1 Tax=Vreelandella titanicae TaxID=664683 RepID=UPI001F36CFCE|nr:NADP-dependent oxidoreductase [Halomonas titanicae]MCE7517050.1 NADP-dependent oxidoreductase [Halomonas titanicae]